MSAPLCPYVIEPARNVHTSNEVPNALYAIIPGSNARNHKPVEQRSVDQDRPPWGVQQCMCTEYIEGD